ncbi:peptidylprolyl isomerase [Bacillus cereus]|uniref:peptidylprolyl isomerase n=1 Tax=Bacillus cereus TaxID=1396 RepID=UPI0009528C88|nr:peptidylprolyl isomerase [Bacillus cereus]OLR26494.1 peptidylprolyl isomerase [Bacillus cereus]
MYKKVKLASVLLGSAILFAACGNTGEVVTSKVGAITQKELGTNLQQQYGKIAVYQMMVKKVLIHDYPVSEKEVNQKLEELKKQTNQKNVTDLIKQFGLPNEEALKEQLKAQVALENAVKKSITEKELKENYKPEIRASHILVADEKTAKEVEEKIKQGEDFATLAKQYSTDTGSKEKGGDLGVFGPGIMQKEFEDAAYKLQVGEVSEPVKTTFGYHIIKLTEKKELKPYEQEKENIRKTLEQKRLQDQAWQQQFIQKLLEKANITVKDAEFKDVFKQEKKK